jgi:hypothetical protein
MPRVYQVLFIVFVIGLFSGCNRSIATPFAKSTDRQSTEIAAKLDQKFSIKYDQITHIESEDLDIQFTDVIGDSRCPSETQCVFQGQVEITLHVVRGDRDLGNVNLIRQAGLENAAIAKLDGYSIQLLDVKPYPKTAQSIDLSDYTAILEVSH